MILFLVCFSAGGSFLLGFLLFFHPLSYNKRANQLLGLFVFTLLGLSFTDMYLRHYTLEKDHIFLSLWVRSLRFIAAPLLYLSIKFFMNPARVFKASDLLHFLPFSAYLLVRLFFIFNGKNAEFNDLWKINDLPLEAYFLPLQMIIYAVISYRNLVQHRLNLKLISSTINEIDLRWLKIFLLILIVNFLFWINEIFFDITFLVKLDPVIYVGSVYFLAYFSIKQRSIFTDKGQDLKEISAVFDEAQKKEEQRPKRLSEAQLVKLKARLDILISAEKIYLENDLSLSQVAQKLEIGIHDASFFINEVTGESFYNFINKHRVEEAKNLLTSGKSDALNMLGIAFAAGFNSKTTFNTTFKKMTGMSPSQFVRSER